MIPERVSGVRKSVPEAKKIKKNQDGLQTGREVSPADIPFHRQGIITDGKKRKRTHLFL